MLAAGRGSALSEVRHPRGFVAWEVLPAAALDPPVRALVAALNRTGWARTVFSCGGHPEEVDSVERERRQAHVDVVVSDLARWRRFVERVREQVRIAVGRLGTIDGIAGAGEPVAGVRCIEGALGPIPPWLAAAVEGADRSAAERRARNDATVSHGWAAEGARPSPTEPAGAQNSPRRAGESTNAARVSAVPWWHRLFGRLGRGPPGGPKWHYRRLVLEPVPYAALPPDACRRVLDAALDATVRALATISG
jgi:hypothetical protein